MQTWIDQSNLTSFLGCVHQCKSRSGCQWWIQRGDICTSHLIFRALGFVVFFIVIKSSFKLLLIKRKRKCTQANLIPILRWKANNILNYFRRRCARFHRLAKSSLQYLIWALASLITEIGSSLHEILINVSHSNHSANVNSNLKRWLRIKNKEPSSKKQSNPFFNIKKSSDKKLVFKTRNFIAGGSNFWKVREE